MAKSKAVKEAEVYAGLPQRVTELENLVEQMGKDVFELQKKCLPLYNIDIDLLFREFWALRLKFNANVNVATLDAEYKNTNNLRYRKAVSYIDSSMPAAVGKMTLADDPLEVARNWYAEAKAYVEKLGITSAFIDPPETIFPKSNQQEGT
jgi:hypothetical protein